MRAMLAAMVVTGMLGLGCGDLDESLPDDPVVVGPSLPGGGNGGGLGGVGGVGTVTTTPTCMEQDGWCRNRPCPTGYHSTPSRDCNKPWICCVAWEQ